MLTSRQRAALRGMANEMPAIFQIGKGGINENLVTQVNEALEARELIKVSVLKTAPEEVRTLGQELCTLCGAQLVAAIGGKLIIYKQSREHQVIFLA